MSLWRNASRLLTWVLLLCVASSVAHADRIDDVITALGDPSFKVRVQAAVILGKINDPRSVPALIKALSDSNESVRGVAATSLGRLGDRRAAEALQRATADPSEFVSSQARHALELVANGNPPPPPPDASSRFAVSVGFMGGGKLNGQYGKIFHDGLFNELKKVPKVTLSDGNVSVGSRHLQGFLIDGTIERLSATRTGAEFQVDCDIKAFVASLPDKAIKVITTEGASLRARDIPGEVESAKRDCLLAASEAVREDVGKFLHTLD